MSDTARYLKPGTLVADRYMVERLIGHGGMGAVYEATDQRLKGTVALKQTLLSGEKSHQAFEHEAQLLARLRHPALPKVIDYFLDDSGQFLVMEFFPGNDLAHLVEQRGEPFPVAQVLDWGDQLLKVLAYLHRQDPPVLHRDIKPQNLKLSDDGEVVLLDFGLAKSKAKATSRVTSSGSVVGYTPMYAPLEQIQGTGTDPRSDLYALAATLHHLLTAAPPVDTLTRAAASVSHQPDPQRPAHEIQPAVPAAVSDVLMQTLALAPDERPASAEAMREMLAQARQAEEEQQGTAPRKAAPAPQPVPDWEQETQTDRRRRPPQVAAPPEEYAHEHEGTPPAAQPTIQLPPTAAPADGGQSEIERRPAAPPAAHKQGEAARPSRPSPIGYEDQKARQQKYRSFFWPILLIGIGVLWLLKNLGIITTVDLSTALRLWPLYLIMIGIDALTGRRSRRLNALAGTIGALIVLAVIAYSSVLGIESTSRQRTETVSAPIGAAESADVVLEFGRADVRVFALDDSDSLIDASISHQGTLQFEEGNPEAEQRTVRLATEEQGGFSFFDWFGDNSGRRWEIGLTPMVTLELDVEGGVGDATLALQDLDLMHLDIEGGIGELQLSLPDTDNGYSAQVTGGIGDIEIAIPDGATVERLNVSIGIGDVSMSIGENTQVDALVAGGVGDFTLEVPEDAAVRVVADTDMGDMDLPDEFRPVERGVWETSGFAGAARQIMVEFDGDIGDLDVDTR